MPQPAIAMPVWPVGTKTLGRPRRRASRSSSRQTVILPSAQSVPTVATVVASTVRLAPLGTSSPAGGRRRSRSSAPVRTAASANSVSSEMKSWSPLSTSSPRSIACRIVARHDAGSLPPAGAMPISSVSGSPAIASSSEATTGTSRSSPGTWSRTVLPARVESITATTGSGA